MYVFLYLDIFPLNYWFVETLGTQRHQWGLFNPIFITMGLISMHKTTDQFCTTKGRNGPGDSIWMGDKLSQNLQKAHLMVFTLQNFKFI